MRWLAEFAVVFRSPAPIAIRQLAVCQNGLLEVRLPLTGYRARAESLLLDDDLVSEGAIEPTIDY
ncbi:hypothetical protein BBD46_18200 [Natrialba sp. SSL1]|nr:hypothetical protein BBD46_18200 [Natrialba sp. SSL1]